MTTAYYFELGASKIGVATAPSDTPTINVLNRADGSLLVTGASMTKEANMTGLCTYTYNGADGLRLVALAHSTDITIDRQDFFLAPALVSLIPQIQSGLATATALSTLQGNVTTILADYARRTGDYSTLTAANVWDALTSGFITAGSIGKLILDNLNATISSRLAASYAAGNDSRVNAIKERTDRLPDSPASTSDVHTSIAISSTVAAAVSTGSMAIEAGYTFRQSVTSTIIGDLSVATKLWLVLKQSKSDSDDAALIYVEKTGGLTRVNGSNYATIANGSLTITGSSGAWNVAAFIDYSATALLYGVNNSGRVYAGLKAKIGADEVSVWESETSTVIDGIVRTT